ncbi:RNA polymerase sigma-70 factor [Neobacillus dielmonensis]|uniref:RNA polymerase sigma-70 factor n=1 Tax=Neobacillus dielmonensis TaxID=1347369 RepID=UPI0005A9CE70|nr:RNA polymerase sigma-70 factor [Neobacillus dielmonensis]
MGLAELYHEYRPLLFSIAYRMLGTISDAEDIVQDVFLRVEEKDMTDVVNQKAYLCKMVTNSCLDLLKSARKQREVYTGPWLPEPIVLLDNDPYTQALKDEMITFAVLLLLEKLTPIERAIFILREVFEYDYQTIAEIVERQEPACRKIFSRVKKKFPFNNEAEIKNRKQGQEAIVSQFLSAIFEGNLQQLETLLASDVTLYSDGGGKVLAALKPISTKKNVLRFIQYLYGQVYQDDQSSQIQIANINGQPGIIAATPDNNKTVISFHAANNQIQEIYIVRNPDKLKHIQMGDTPPH